MKTSEGKTYRVELDTQDAGEVGPGWLTGAFLQAFPKAAVTAILGYGNGRAEVTLLWRSGEGAIHLGSYVSSSVEGLPVVGAVPPSGIVTAISLISEREPTRPKISSGMNFGGAVALLGATWWLVRRQQRAAGRSA